MPGLNTSQKTAMRKRLETSFLTDKCDIYKHVFIPDDTGSSNNAWVLMLGNVNCRVEEMSFRAGQIEAYAGVEYLSIIYKIYFPYNTELQPDYRFYHNGSWYETRVLDLDMSDNLYQKIHVVKILNVRN